MVDGLSLDHNNDARIDLLAVRVILEQRVYLLKIPDVYFFRGVILILCDDALNTTGLCVFVSRPANVD